MLRNKIEQKKKPVRVFATTRNPHLPTDQLRNIQSSISFPTSASADALRQARLNSPRGMLIIHSKVYSMEKPGHLIGKPYDGLYLYPVPNSETLLSGIDTLAKFVEIDKQYRIATAGL